MLPKSPPQQSSAPTDFVTVTFLQEEQARAIQVPAGASALRAFRHLGVAQYASLLPPQTYDKLEDFRLHVPSLPLLQGHGFLTETATKKGLCTVWPQLLNVFDSLTSECEELCYWSPSGCRVRDAEEFGRCVIATTQDPVAPDLPMHLLAKTLPQMCNQTDADELRLECPASAAVDAWLGFPFHLAQAFGWSSSVLNYPPQKGAPMYIGLQPAQTGHLPMDLMPSQLRQWYLVAMLDHQASTADLPSVSVEIQDEACRKWWGTLPARLVVSELEQWWHAAPLHAICPRGARVFSGPHPIPCGTTIEETRLQTRT